MNDSNKTRTYEEKQEFLKYLIGCDIRELYSLLVSASCCLNDAYNARKEEKFLIRSKRLKELYTKLYEHVKFF